MAKFCRSAILSLLFGIFSIAISSIATEVPKNMGFVVDDAKVIDEANRASLENSLSAFKSQTGKQISILTIPNHDGVTMEEFAIKAFDAWQIGKKGEDNGVLVLISIKEREVRIEVGYGLEGYLTDISTYRINESMAHYFKEGRWGEGLKVGIPQIMAISAQDKEIVSKVEFAAKELAQVGYDRKGDLLECAACAYIFGSSNLLLCGAIGAYGVIEAMPFTDLTSQILVGSIGALFCILLVLISRYTGYDFSLLLLFGMFSKKDGDSDDSSSDGEGGKSGGGGNTLKY